MGDQPSTCCPVYNRYLTPTQIESIRLVNGVIRGDVNLVKSALKRGANVNTRLGLNIISMGDNAPSAKKPPYRSSPHAHAHSYHSSHHSNAYGGTNGPDRTRARTNKGTQFGSPWMHNIHGDHDGDDHSSAMDPGGYCNGSMDPGDSIRRPPTSPRSSASSHGHLTPLMRAMSQGDEEIVKILLESGANMDEKDENGFCALTMAVADGQIDLVEKIWDRFSQSSKMNLQDYCDGFSAYASSKGEDPDVSPEAMKRVNSLLKNGPEWPDELIIIDY